MNNRRLTFGVMVSCFALMAIASVEGGEAVPPMSEQIAGIKARVAHYEARAQRITDEMIALDSEMEKDVDVILKLVISIKDSTDSKTRVTNLKHDIVERLGNSIKVYQKNRARRLEAFRMSSVNEPKDTAHAAVGALDARIEKRVAQIMEVSASLTTHKDWAHYDRYRRDEYDNYAQTEEYTRYKRTLSNSEHQKSKVFDALEESIKDLDAEIVKLKQKISLAYTSELKALWQDRMDFAVETQAKRKKQILELMSAQQAPARSLGQREAFRTESIVEDMVTEVAEDYRRLYQIGRRRNAELSKLKQWQDQLGRAEAYAKANPDK
jgi:hypothetical protein